MVSWKIYENDTTSEIIFGPIVQQPALHSGQIWMCTCRSCSIFHDTILSTTPPRATAVVLISGGFLLVKHRLRAAKFSNLLQLRTTDVALQQPQFTLDYTLQKLWYSIQISEPPDLVFETSIQFIGVFFLGQTCFLLPETNEMIS